MSVGLDYLNCEVKQLEKEIEQIDLDLQELQKNQETQEYQNLLGKRKK